MHIYGFYCELGCLCGKAGTSHLCDGSAHSSGCVVNGSNAMAAIIIPTDSKFPLESVVIVGLVVPLTGIVVSAVAIVIGFIKSKR